MTKTQIQLPEDLYREVKEFARQREWSLAETFRRGVEELLRQYPENPTPRAEWKLPEPQFRGYRQMSEAELKRHAQEDFD